MRSLTTLVAAIALSLANCAVLNSISTSSQSLNSISTSLNSVSTSLDSISASLGSISDSFAPDSDSRHTAYIRDVRNYTALFVRSGNASDAFLTGLDDVARANGVIHWEARPETYVSVGAGLRQAQVTDDQFASVVAPLDRQARRLVERGFSG